MYNARSGLACSFQNVDKALAVRMQALEQERMPSKNSGAIISAFSSRGHYARLMHRMPREALMSPQNFWRAFALARELAFVTARALSTFCKTTRQARAARLYILCCSLVSG